MQTQVLDDDPDAFGEGYIEETLREAIEAWEAVNSLADFFIGRVREVRSIPYRGTVKEPAPDQPRPACGGGVIVWPEGERYLEGGSGGTRSWAKTSSSQAQRFVQF